MVFALDHYPLKVGRTVAQVAVATATDLYHEGFQIDRIELSLENHTISIEVFGENEEETRSLSQDVHVRSKK